MGIHERKIREKEERRRQIMEAAKLVFSAKGFNRATMEEIAGEAELSPGTLYLYFKNKEELHTSLSIDILKYLTRQIRDYVDERNMSPEAKIYALRDAFINVYEYDAMVLINLFHLQAGETLKNLSGEVLQQIKEASGDALGAITSIVQEGIDQGVFVDKHPVALADIIWATYSGVVLWVDSKRLLNNEKDFVKQTLETAFDLIVAGLRNL
ncbi:HTH-type transcriptional regulator [Desulforapulum autotrophicum HRM2]|uniref:HTH-type transcriptional regulator n=1 Tax=Desulforapulum autotrophicum (strain ATCC 43914 / DSM 3382 / VKM B-1955 / HRM2) TaxID=177437 RepID=C0QDK0_DESAH|nr:TetR/AcrR family transcriptional regulator [Desulforapulum autotrophicum]ACN15264.1 HTH-type transcriptional regulator [Desulforapulum autotrophicum HRM2]